MTCFQDSGTDEKSLVSSNAINVAETQNKVYIENMTKNVATSTGSTENLIIQGIPDGI